MGGCTPYLALRARAGLGRAAVDAALEALQIQELPAVRGCTYLVGQADFAVAMQAGQSERDLKMARQHLGVTETEVERLCEGILEALAEPLDPAELKTALGERVRHLGEAGKKRGLTTTLGLGLGRLQGLGLIRKLPMNGRLDQQRFRYARWSGFTPVENVTRELARRYFAWAGPAPLAAFAAWTGLSQKVCRQALEGLDVDELPEGLLLRRDREAWESFAAPDEPEYALLGSLDNLFHLQRVALGGSETEHHVIVDRGRLIGHWDYDALEGRLVWKCFEPASAALRAEVERVETWVREELGDARSFSLDSPESRRERLARLG